MQWHLSRALLILIPSTLCLKYLLPLLHLLNTSHPSRLSSSASCSRRHFLSPHDTVQCLFLCVSLSPCVWIMTFKVTFKLFSNLFESHISLDHPGGRVWLMFIRNEHHYTWNGEACIIILFHRSGSWKEAPDCRRCLLKYLFSFPFHFMDTYSLDLFLHFIVEKE